MPDNLCRITKLIEEIDTLMLSEQFDSAIELAKNYSDIFYNIRESKNANSVYMILELLIVGPGRTGTTWLKSTLSVHPYIIMARGEPNVLWNIDHGNLLSALQFYANNENWRGAFKKGALICEKSPGYISLPTSSLIVLSIINPDLLIIFGRRRENERLWSAVNHRMRAKNHSGDWYSFCCQNSEEILHHIDAGRVNYHIERWKSHFANLKFYVLNFNELSSNFLFMFNEIIKFIRIRPLNAISSVDREKILQRILVNPNPSNGGFIPHDFEYYIQSISRI